MKWKDKKKKERNQKKRKNSERIIKNKIIRNIRTLFEQEEDYCKPKRENSIWNDNYTEYESNGDNNRDSSLDEYLNNIKTYLRNIIIESESCDTWKIQLAIAINFISSKDTEEEHVMYSYNDAIEVLMHSLSQFVQNTKTI